MATGSVLYVVESPVVEQGRLASAQAYAIAHDLPFAVVYCVQEVVPAEQLARIRTFSVLEASLQPYAIPLMILIGRREKVLPWMSGHVKPVRIFTDADADEGGYVLQKHPLTWPGRVMTIHELEALISSDQSYCLPD